MSARIVAALAPRTGKFIKNVFGRGENKLVYYKVRITNNRYACFLKEPWHFWHLAKFLKNVIFVPKYFLSQADKAAVWKRFFFNNVQIMSF